MNQLPRLLIQAPPAADYDQPPAMHFGLIGRRAQVVAVTPLQVRFQGEQIDVDVPLVDDGLVLSTSDTVLVVQLHGTTWCAIAKLVAS